MPVPYIESMDDPLVYDQQAAFLGGQVSFPRASSLEVHQAWWLQNVDIDTNGVIHTRFGFQAFGNLLTNGPATIPQGAHWYSTPGGSFMLVVADGNLWRGDSLGNWFQIQAGAFPNDGQPAYFAQIVESLYISTGGKPKFWNLAGILAGTAGVEITDGPARLIYLVAHEYRLMGFNPDKMDELWTGRRLPTDAAPFLFDTADPASEILPTRVGEGEGEPITALVPWKGPNLVVFKGDSCWLVNTTTVPPLDKAFTSQFVIGRISGRVGCVAHRSAAPVGNDLYFMARDGVRSLSRTQADGDGEVSLPLSDPVQDIMDRRNLLTLNRACGIAWGGKYIVAFPAEASFGNELVMALTVRTGAWQLWTGPKPIQFVVSAFPGQNQRLCELDGRAQLAQYQDYRNATYRDAGDYVDLLEVDGTGQLIEQRPAWLIRTRSCMFSELLNTKQPRNVELVFDKSEALVSVFVLFNDDGSTRLAIPKLQRFKTGGEQVVLTPTSPVLPFTLGTHTLVFAHADLTWLPSCRSLALELVEAPNLTAEEEAVAGPIGMQRATLSAWMNAMEARP